MDKARLEELRENCEFAMKHGHFIPTTDTKDILALIDSALAETDDAAVREAIEWVEATLSDSNIWQDGDFGIPVKQSEELEDIKQTILAALRQMQVEPPCEAKTKIEKQYDKHRSYTAQGDCYKYVCSCMSCGKFLWEIEDYEYSKDRRGNTPKYCPNCGRKLVG